MTDYGFIESKINALKSSSTFLRNKSNDFVFSALCVKSLFYKNPSLKLTDSDFDDIIVDGPYDGGVDVLLSDPSSEESDLIIGQSKYYEESLKEQDVLDALNKMWLFYKDMSIGHYEQVNEVVQRRFLSLNSEVSDDAKIHFVFFTSAPRNRISIDRIKRKFSDFIADECSNYLIDIFFGADIVDEIKEAESRRPCVDYGVINIDKPDNMLIFGDDNDPDAVVVNISAYSIKKLYAEHSVSLLSKNLRYFVKSREIDRGINQTISDNPDEFWFRNNGITIICDDFTLDGKVAKLWNFSIINGGQTTHLLYKSTWIDETHDIFLQCKIIRVQGDSEDEKNTFCLDIAKATNAQKPIKPFDLKSNAPEQLRFSQTLRDVGVFYQTKRGENIPKDYNDWYKNTNMVEIGKLCLCGIFQMPCASRNKPTAMYDEKFYNLIFNSDQQKIASICKELLYIDFYYRNTYIKAFDKENEDENDKDIRIQFAHNARTICIAFVSLASRYMCGNISDADIEIIRKSSSTNATSDSVYDLCRNLDNFGSLFPCGFFDDKDKVDILLKKLFDTIIDEGIRSFINACRYDPSVTATNFLKKDKNYYIIISDYWRELRSKIKEVFPSMIVN